MAREYFFLNVSISLESFVARHEIYQARSRLHRLAHHSNGNKGHFHRSPIKGVQRNGLSSARGWPQPCLGFVIKMCFNRVGLREHQKRTR